MCQVLLLNMASRRRKRSQTPRLDSTSDRVKFQADRTLKWWMDPRQSFEDLTPSTP